MSMRRFRRAAPWLALLWLSVAIYAASISEGYAAVFFAFWSGAYVCYSVMRHEK